MKRLPLAVSFVLFVLLCASIAYWGMQLFKPPLRPVAAPPRAAAPEIRPDAATALFGGRAAPAQAASNYQLRGVIFSGNARDSIAILSADGKPPQAVRVDMEILPGVTVKEVHRGYVLLSDNGATKRVELPEDAKSGGVTAAPVPTAPAVPAMPSQPGRNFPAPARPPAATPQQQQQPAVPNNTTQPARPAPPNAALGAPQVGIPQPATPATGVPATPVPGAAGQPTTAPPTVVVNPPAGTPSAGQSVGGGVPLPNTPQVPNVPNAVNMAPSPVPGGPPASGSTAPGEPPLQSR
ncbi:type II secretion system protein N [Noviherbaspirillum sp. Root189]|uniref:type II secretion system protein N n=1 Tax=Noviherbaspirillum sp. Root189 TaxID=1736487 RepID=UPI0009E8A4E5|nr:type II secretion system protein N [Noviherbaspirillum sp. Root189]